MNEKNLNKTTMPKVMTEENDRPQEVGNLKEGKEKTPEQSETDNKGNDLINKVKNMVMQHKKIAGGIAILLLLSIIIAVYFGSQPKKLSDMLKIDFKGYDGYGEVEFNHGELDKTVTEVMYKEAGLTEKDIKDAEKGLDGLLDAIPKYLKAEQEKQRVSYSFDKTDHLKNGDKVIFTVTCSGEKCPFAKETKEYEVKGLQETEKITTDDLEKEYPITFIGYNHFGRVEFDDTIYDINTKINDTITNDSEIKIKIKDSAIEELAKKGKVIQDNISEYKKKVTGLPEVSMISGLDELYDKVNTYMQTETQNSDTDLGTTTYTVEKQKDYLEYKAPYKAAYVDDDLGGYINVRTVYKITKVFETKFRYLESSEKTYYTYFGYEGVDVVDNKVILKDKNSGKTHSYSTWDNLESIEAEIKNDGYMEYKTQ